MWNSPAARGASTDTERGVSNRVTASSNSGNGTATISIIITGPFCLITNAAPVPATPQEHQRTALSVPVESDAKISPELQQDFDLMYEFAHFVRASGYRCDSISALAPHPVSHGYEFVCNRFAYKYGIEHKNSRWIVTVE
jgi:hypothetical protein